MSDNRELHLAKGFAVPRAIAARTVFVAGTKGSGKTYTAGVMAEEMLAAGVHVVILDPLGVWWGLRHDAGGGPGGHPIFILGGEHADVPLLATGGGAVAEYVVRSGQSCILDMSGFESNAAQDRFVTDLLTRLFRMKAADKAALHLVIDEADLFAPERPQGREMELLGATKTIVTKGRSRGLSMTMITQRPQSIAKAAIEESDVILCHRMQGVRAVAAMKSWTDLYAGKEEAATFYESLPKLADGECWAWSPQFLKTFERHQIRRKHTFDSSRTPDPGEAVRRPKAAAAVDLAKLTAEMKATADEAKANDPAELRRRIQELEKQVAAKPAAATPRVERVEVPVLKDGQLARAESLVGKMEQAADKLRVEAAELRRVIAPATAANVAGRHADRVPPRDPHEVTPERTPGARPATTGGTKSPVSIRSDGLTEPQQKILDTVLMLEARGVPASRDTVARWLGIHPNGGSYGANLGALRSGGYLAGFALTDVGRPAARVVATGMDAALAALPDEAKRKIVRTLAEAGRPLTRDELAAALGIHPNGGSYGANLGWLRTMGLITARGPMATMPALCR